MFALLPLVGGLLLGRFTTLRVAVAVQVVFYAVATAVLIGTAPRHGGTHADGVLLSLVLLPFAALVVYLGLMWRRRSQRAGVAV